MRKQYDDFTKQSISDMSKSMSDMTYLYLQPETNLPTVVPPSHYKNLLSKVREQVMDEITRVKFIDVMYTQLKALRDEDSKYFHQAMICLDMNIKPDDLRPNEKIALLQTYDWLERKMATEKKDFHLLDSSIIEFFEETKNDKDLHRQIIEYSKSQEEPNIEFDEREEPEKDIFLEEENEEIDITD